MSRRTKQLVELGTAIVGLYWVSQLVMPGRNTAAVIQAATSGFSDMIKVAVGETAIHKRERRALQLLGEMSDEEMTYLFAGLTDSDLDWIELQLVVGNE